jgi:cell division protein FtsA
VDNRKKYVVAVDVGTSEVVIAVGSISASGSINVEAVVAEPCEGMKAGLVDNSQMVTESLRRARSRAEQQAGIAITDADVTISGKFVRCASYIEQVAVEAQDACISQRDVNALRERMRNVKAVDGEIIMDCYPVSYKGASGVVMQNPVGSYSPQLSSTYNFILCENMAKERLQRVFLGAGIKIRNLYAGAAVVGESVVNSDEREDGVAVVDIGSGVTDVAIYQGGILRHIATIPMGSAIVNADIRAYAGTIPPKIVESLKCRYGSAMVELTPDEKIEIPSASRAIKPILRLNLATVIEARMSEIAEYVWAEIRDAGYAKQLAAGIVLTGGGAALDHLADLFQKITSQQVRVSCAEVGIATEAFEQVASPNLTMAVSLLLRAAHSGACPVRELQTAGPVKSVASPAKSEQKYVTPEPPVAEPKAEVVTPPIVNEPVVKDTDNWGNEVDDGGDIDEDDEPQSNKKGLLGWFIRQINGAFKPVDDIDDEEEDY